MNVHERGRACVRIACYAFVGMHDADGEVDATVDVKVDVIVDVKGAA
jgi:hypothetical protein